MFVLNVTCVLQAYQTHVLLKYPEFFVKYELNTFLASIVQAFIFQSTEGIQSNSGWTGCFLIPAKQNHTEYLACGGQVNWSHGWYESSLIVSPLIIFLLSPPLKFVIVDRRC